MAVNETLRLQIRATELDFQSSHKNIQCAFLIPALRGWSRVDPWGSLAS